MTRETFEDIKRVLSSRLPNVMLGDLWQLFDDYERQAKELEAIQKITFEPTPQELMQQVLADRKEIESLKDELRRERMEVP